MHKQLLMPLLVGTLISHTAIADEGQWQPHQLTKLQDEFTRIGIELPAAQVADLNSYPMNAVIGLGYCSAAFVSSEGLVVTNHHCAAGAIQYNTTVENQLATQGFLAKTKANEPSAGPQERLYITQGSVDVTDKVLNNLADSLTGKERYDIIEQRSKQLVAQCEANPNMRCSVRSYHHGMQYFLLKQLMIKDVRLVYAPPNAVGEFGGDIDNYEYPRHSGDFTFLRAYVDKSGNPAPYHKDNVPYRPDSWLKVNAQGVQKGDGILLAGYPGSTSRYRLTDEIRNAADWSYPTSITTMQQTLDVIAQTTKGDDKAKVSYSSTVRSINNRMKKYKGLLDGFKATDIHQFKQQKEQALLKWMASDKSRQSYNDAYQQLSKLLQQSQAMYQRDYYYSYATRSALLRAASSLYRLAKESEKPDAQRKRGYQKRDLAMFKARLKRMQRRYVTKVDSALWQLYLTNYMNQSHRVAALDKSMGLTAKHTPGQLSAKLEKYYTNSTLHDEAARLAWIGKPVKAFVNSKDPIIQLAVNLYETNQAFEVKEEELIGQLAKARPEYMRAVIAFNESRGLPVYPDANGTLRVTYGSVDGYPAKDGIYKTAYTTIKGMKRKNTGVAPFDLPKRVLNKMQPSSYKVPVNFLSSADTTGGNSGSPVLNGKGELVGLNFDSTYESISKDWYFNPAITRAIHVDIRFVLWMLTEVDNADNLIKEMSIITQ